MRPGFFATCLLSLLSACVCGGPHGDEPDDDPECGDPASYAEPSREQGRAYLDGISFGSAMSITVGPQGGCMVTPTVCVDAPWLSGRYEDQCMILTFENELAPGAQQSEPPAISPGSSTLTRFERFGDDVWCARGAWNYLDDCYADLGGAVLDMQVEVRGSDGDFARGEASVRLQE